MEYSLLAGLAASLVALCVACYRRQRKRAEVSDGSD